jgi:hypothetical protein
MRSPVKFGDVTLVDTMLKDGLVDAFHHYHMGITGKISPYKVEGFVSSKEYYRTVFAGKLQFLFCSFVES